MSADGGLTQTHDAEEALAAALADLLSALRVGSEDVEPFMRRYAEALDRAVEAEGLTFERSSWDQRLDAGGPCGEGAKR